MLIQAAGSQALAQQRLLRMWLAPPVAQLPDSLAAAAL